jgi:hypothetical protein
MRLLIALALLLAPSLARADEPPACDATAPLLIGFGMGGMMAGGAAATVGSAIDRCGDGDDDPACAPRFGLIWGGAVFAGLSGGVLVSLGSRHHKRHFGEVTGKRRERYDLAMFAGGISLVALGSASIAAGLGLSSQCGCATSHPPKCTCTTIHPISPVLIGAGTPLAVIGTPLAVVGSRWVAPEDVAYLPELEPWGTGADLRWRF